MCMHPISQICCMIYSFTVISNPFFLTLGCQCVWHWHLGSISQCHSIWDRFSLFHLFGHTTTSAITDSPSVTMRTPHTLFCSVTPSHEHASFSSPLCFFNFSSFWSPPASFWSLSEYFYSSPLCFSSLWSPSTYLPMNLPLPVLDTLCPPGLCALTFTI